MPAITILSGKDLPDIDKIKSAHQTARYDERYNVKINTHDNFLFASATYPDYPLRRIEFGKTTVIVEGFVYNRDEDQLQEELKERFVFEEKSPTSPEWLRKLDGEFVFYAYDKSESTVLIIPDLLGQLPLFYTTDTEYAVVGRNKPAIARTTDNCKVDRMGAAQFLRIGYSLPYRTLYKSIHRVPEGSHIQINTKTGNMSIPDHYQFNLDNEVHSDTSLSNNARILAKRFARATQLRSNKCSGTNVVLLSGGLDARGTLAAFERLSSDCVTATRDFKHDSQADIDIAGQLARAVGTEWYHIQVAEVTGEDLLYHLDMTAGADPFDIGHIQPFLRDVRSQMDSPVFAYTGDGGDKILPDISPSVNLKSHTDLVDYILNSESKFDASYVEKVCGVTEDDIRSSIKDRVKKYPESSLEKKYSHFKIFDRGFGWLFEATDTNRNHFWTTSPYYSLDVFDYAMNCPDTQKRRYRLHTAFLEHLSPTLASIPNANFEFGISPDSKLHEVRPAVNDFLNRNQLLSEFVKPILRSILQSDSEGPTQSQNQMVMNCIHKQIQSNNSVIDISDNHDAIAELQNTYSRGEIYHLFTLTSLLDYHEDGAVLEQYSSAKFD